MENQERIEAVCRMQTYIEAHLEEPITLHLLAEQAGYSPWHCAKIFKDLTGKAPFEYIRSCRLSQAALRLRDYNPKIVDVAMDFVFDSHEGFTRAFRRQFGMSPKDYKKNTPPLPLFHPWSVRDSAYYYSDTKEELPPLISKRNLKKAVFLSYCRNLTAWTGRVRKARSPWTAGASPLPRPLIPWAAASGAGSSASTLGNCCGIRPSPGGS